MITYNTEWLQNLEVIKETKRWLKKGSISGDQFNAIQQAHFCGFYHPNFIIRILLFIATILALSGVTGFLALIIADAGDNFIFTGCILYGIGSFFALEGVFIKSNNHYKSGVTEALLYHACGFTIVGVAGATDGDTRMILITCIIVFSFAAIRYIDLITTLASFGCLAGYIFFEFYEIGGVFRNIIPFVFLIFFTPVYFYVRRIRTKQTSGYWNNNLILVESLTLLVVYAAGNYMVVRELSSELMGLYLEDGQDIPYAFIFYFLTIVTPLAYIYFGIKLKDLILIRVSLFVLAFSVFTFKFYYGFGHPEISLTVAGAFLTGVTLLLMNYLKTVRYGYTRENLLDEKWGNMNIQAIVISQTLGGNQAITDDQFKGGGGSFGGGGASGDF